MTHTVVRKMLKNSNIWFYSKQDVFITDQQLETIKKSYQKVIMSKN